MFDEERMKVLLGDYFDESLEGEAREELEQLVISSARAREMFWAAADQHALGREWALARLGRNVAEMVRPRSHIRRWIPIGAVAACLVLGAAGVWKFSGTPQTKIAEVEEISEEPVIEAVPHEDEQAVAFLGLSSAAVWGDGMNRLTGDALPPGPLVLKSGTVRIDFFKGARGWFQGPAELELVSQGELKMNRGAILVRVPPAAEGFRVISGDLVVRDFGTEFGVVVGENPSEKEVHVFEGEVEVSDGKLNKRQRMLAGEGMRLTNGAFAGIPAMKGVFPDPTAVWQQVTGREKEQFKEWRDAAEALGHKRGMLVHYLFSQKNPEGRIPNMVPGAPSLTDGTLIGGEWGQGRWEGKSALAFRGGNDRMRLVVPGTYDAMTWMVWLKLDEFPEKLTPLWRGESLEPGCIHWNIDPLGRVRMGVKTAAQEFLTPDDGKPSDWDLALSPQLMADAVGRWVHLAAVYDSRAQKISMWMDGRQIASKKLRHSIPAIPGICQIGSSFMEDGVNQVTTGQVTPDKHKPGVGVRTLNGRIDEFAVVGLALSEKEIRAHYLNGRPYAGELAEPASW